MKKLFCVLLVILLCLSCAGCKKAPKAYEATDFYDLTMHDEDQTFSYTFSDLKGKVLFQKEHTDYEPVLNTVAPNVYELLTQADDVLSANWAVYCDVKNSKVSEVFHYVLLAVDNYVIYATTKNGERFVVVQQIFDLGEGLYRREYKLENATPEIADFISDCEEGENKTVAVRYLVGNPSTVATLTVTLP